MSTRIEYRLNPRLFGSEQLFLDDNVRNIAAGKAVGLRTVLVRLAFSSQDIVFLLHRSDEFVAAFYRDGSKASTSPIDLTNFR